MAITLLPDGWVKMSERFPDDGRYLVSVLNPFFGSFTITMDYAYFSDGIWRSWSNNKKILVIAWKKIEDDFNPAMFPELKDLFCRNGQEVWEKDYNGVQFGTNEELDSLWKYY